MPTATLSVSISEHDNAFLKNLANLTGQSEACIAASAIKNFVGANERQIEIIRERLAAADRHEYASSERVKATFAKWGLDAD